MRSLPLPSTRYSKEFSSFGPVPLDIIAENPRDAVYDNRLQTSLHFGAWSPMDSC